MASSSSRTAHSTSAPLRTYDVFLSFRGEDTRMGFTDHLYSALKERGIFVFRDEEELQQGEYISEKLLKAIQESEYAIVVISDNYAFSKWCLIELTEIVKCKRKKQVTILPIFYHVDPSDVRKQKGNFANAFIKHREEPEVNKEQWRDALTEVGKIVGWHIHDSHESTTVQEICGEIFNGLSYRLSIKFKNVVGIGSQVKEIMTLLRGGVNDVRFIGICGMGGIGKTTLANVIFEMFCSEFEASCFVADVSEEAKRKGIVYLQRQLISRILKVRDTKIWNCNDGIRVIANKFRGKKIFIVLDNIDDAMQIEALAESGDWFGEGSRILLTSRNNHLLKRFVDEIYEVRGLSNNDALQLFCLKAFKKDHPANNYEDLSNRIVSYAQGLPLALKVFGSLLFKKELNVWDSILKQLKEEPHVEILDKLKISFDALSISQQELFLDIACFFYQENINNVIKKLESLDRHPNSNIQVLQDRSLIKVLHEKFYMHDLLREMGQHIVRGKPLRDPSECSRLWCSEDIIHILKNDTETINVQSIVLHLPLPKPRPLSFEGFSKMKKLRMLVIRPRCDVLYGIFKDKILEDLSTVGWYGDPSKFMLSNGLRVLEWWGYPLKYLPTNFEPDNFVELKMPMSKIKWLWDAPKDLKKLKYMDLRCSPNLVKMPDLSEIPSLEELDIKETAVIQLSSSIILPEKLNVLRMGGGRFSTSITFLPHDLPLHLKFLKELNLSYCNLLDGALLNDIGFLSLLEDLNLSGNNFTRIGSISQLPKLKNLALAGCLELKDLPPKLPLSLGFIELFNCPSLTPFSNPTDLCNSSEMLVAGGIAFCANYFGSGSKRDGASHFARPCINDYSLLGRTEGTVSWGPAVRSDIPEWFDRKSTRQPDIAGMFRFDFDVNVHLVHLDGDAFYESDADFDWDLDVASDSDLIGTNFYDEFPKWDNGRIIYTCWGYALLIVYEVLELNSCQRNSDSLTFPMFVCELQVNNEDYQKVPKKCCGTSPKVPLIFRVPEIPLAGKNGIWVFIDYGCFVNIINEMWWYIGSCSITISSPNVEVKECGGRLVLKHDRPEFCEIIRSISAHDSDCSDVIRSISPDLESDDHSKPYRKCLGFGGPVVREFCESKERYASTYWGTEEWRPMGRTKEKRRQGWLQRKEEEGAESGGESEEESEKEESV